MSKYWTSVSKNGTFQGMISSCSRPITSTCHLGTPLLFEIRVCIVVIRFFDLIKTEAVPRVPKFSKILNYALNIVYVMIEERLASNITYNRYKYNRSLISFCFMLFRIH